MDSNWSRHLKALKIRAKLLIFQPLWPVNLTDDIEKNRTPLLCHLKLYTSFHSHLWFQTGVTVLKGSIWVKIFDFLASKFDRSPWKTMGHLFYAISGFVHHSVAICELKLGLQSGNTQLGSKSSIFLPVWPWNLTGDLEKQKDNFFMPLKLCMYHFVAICDFKLEIQSGNV